MGVKTKFTSTITNPWRRYISINNDLQLWKALGNSGCLGYRTRKESHGVWVCGYVWVCACMCTWLLRARSLTPHTGGCPGGQVSGCLASPRGTHSSVFFPDHLSCRGRPPPSYSHCPPSRRQSSTPMTEQAEPATCPRSPHSSSPRLRARPEPSPSGTCSAPNTTDSELQGHCLHPGYEQASSIRVRAGSCLSFSPVSPTYNSLCQKYCSRIINMQSRGGGRRLG